MTGFWICAGVQRCSEYSMIPSMHVSAVSAYANLAQGLEYA